MQFIQKGVVRQKWAWLGHKIFRADMLALPYFAQPSFCPPLGIILNETLSVIDATEETEDSPFEMDQLGREFSLPDLFLLMTPVL